MDPNEALKNARSALASARTLDATIVEPGASYAARDDLWELADAFEALDGWLSEGGFPPDAWNHANMITLDHTDAPSVVNGKCPECGANYNPSTETPGPANV
jgi:hypothetical protein